jgi:hypothetical protein
MNADHGLRAPVLPLVAFLLVACAAPAVAAEDRVVTSEGLAPVKADDAVAARNAAIENALQKAVEQVVAELIDGEIARQNYQTLNGAIYSKAQGFVQDYDVVECKRDGTLFHVTISATVAIGDVRDDLATLGLLIQAMRKPRVMVMIPETNILDHGWWSHWTTSVGTAETAMIRALKTREFTVMDAPTVRESIDREAALRAIEGDAVAAQRIAQQIGAEVLITGQAVAEPAGTVAGSQVRSYQATVSARAVKADTGEILGVSNGSGKAVHLNATAGGRDALGQAGTQVANDIISQIASQWAKEVSGSRMIALSVAGMSKEMFDDLVSLLKSHVRGVVDVYRRDFIGETARLDVRFLGDAEGLSRSLMGFQPQGGRTYVTAATANKLDIRFVREASKDEQEDP